MLFGIYDYRIIGIALIAGLLSNLIEIPLTVLTTFWLFRHGHDPNNIMGPYVTTTGDISSIISIFVAVLII
jgi:mgtE-like transporter